MASTALVDFFNLEASLAFGLVATLGVGVISFARPAYRIARTCAWIAAALFVSIAIVWGATTKESPWVWVPAVALIGALGAVGLTTGLRAMNAAEDNQQKPKAARDPDTLYQLGSEVGRVEQVVVDRANSLITIGLIRGAMNLDSARDFEYRDYVLSIESIAGEAGQREGPNGRWIERRLLGVRCRVKTTKTP